MTPDIVALDNQYILQTYGRSSFVIERGDGCYLYDTTGQQYLD
jgi:acetylornithine/N-succinyldiaminopimelate aminotransferase